jgi:hypothetical protein
VSRAEVGGILVRGRVTDLCFSPDSVTFRLRLVFFFLFGGDEWGGDGGDTEL